MSSLLEDLEFVLGFICGWCAAHLGLSIEVCFSDAILAEPLKEALECVTERMPIEAQHHPKLSQEDLFYLCLQKCMENPKHREAWRNARKHLRPRPDALLDLLRSKSSKP